MMSDQDHLAVTYYDDGFYAACTCGWENPIGFMTINAAHDEAMDHVEAVEAVHVEAVEGTIVMSDGTRSTFTIYRDERGPYVFTQNGDTKSRDRTFHLVAALHDAVRRDSEPADFVPQ